MRPKYLFLLLLLPIVSCHSSKNKEQPDQKVGDGKPPPMQVDVYIARPEIFQESIEVPGNIVAREVTEIHPEVSGRIVQLNAREGNYVARGTLLAKLYDGDLQAQLNKLKVQLAIAEKTEERQSQLLKIQGISQQDYDLSLLQVNSLKADIGIIQTSIAKTEVRAPFNGRLGLSVASPGAYVTPSSVIAVIHQTDQLKLDFSVPEKYISRIDNGQTVSFRVEGNAQPLIARVIATESNVTENTRSLQVRALVNSNDRSLLPGAFAKVTINFPPENDALLIPSQAVLPQARGKKVILYKNGTAEFADVQTGMRDSTRIRILEGINAGDTIVVTGLLSTRPSSKIRLGRIVNHQ